MDRTVQMRAMLIGGISTGLLSAIPGVGAWGNCCCCGGWIWLGSLIAVYYLVYNSREYPTDGDGVMAGLGAGLISGMAFAVSWSATQLFLSPANFQEALDVYENVLPPEMLDQLRQSLEQSGGTMGAAQILVTVLMILILSALVAAISGFIFIRLLRPLKMGDRGSGGAYHGPAGHYPYGGYPGGPPHPGAWQGQVPQPGGYYPAAPAAPQPTTAPPQAQGYFEAPPDQPTQDQRPAAPLASDDKPAPSSAGLDVPWGGSTDRDVPKGADRDDPGATDRDAPYSGPKTDEEDGNAG